MRRATIVAGSVAAALLVADVSPASAQAVSVMGDDLSPTGKGIAGCALLGAETVLLIEAAAGVDAAWAYIVFPLLGAAGGGVGGFFLEDADQAELSVASLALGVALVIPTTILVLNATSYDPEGDEDEGEEDEEAQEGAELEAAEEAEGGGDTRIERPTDSGAGAGESGGGAAPAPETPPAGGGAGATGGSTGPQSRLRRPSRTRRPGLVGGALVSARADRGFSLGVGVPNISVTGLYSAREQATLAQLGIRAGGTEVRIDLLNLAF
ncbi:MAG: hypothetical protein IT379_02835 [Deltaproteobacteria bacterium]|nr:hypothetical protein [Deltaproteobacteria bacterium]